MFTLRFKCIEVRALSMPDKSRMFRFQFQLEKGDRHYDQTTLYVDHVDPQLFVVGEVYETKLAPEKKAAKK